MIRLASNDERALAMLESLVPASVLQFCAQRGGKLYALKSNERYLHVSPELARHGVDVDLWPAPPSGLFVVKERTEYIRRRSPMTLVHEFGHMIDCCLGDDIGQGGYLTATDPTLRQLFCDARSFVTPYAATSVDEYFAESCRAWFEVNDPASQWPRVSKRRLAVIDPQLHDYLEQLFTYTIPQKIAVAA